MDFDVQNVFTVLLSLALFVLVSVFLWRKGFAGLFRGISDVINGGENAIIDAISAITPYLVPIIPAYLTFFHVHDPQGMNFPVEIAWTSAIVVEFLGMSSMATTIRFWRNNQRYKSDKNQAPFWLALGTYIFYLAVTMTVNVLLEVESATRTTTVIWSIGLFSSLSVPSGVIISIRSIYRDMLDERNEQRKPPQGNNNQPAPREEKKKHASDFAPQIVAMLEKTWQNEKRVLAPKEITARLKLDHEKSKGYVSTKTAEWRAQNGIQKDAAPTSKLTF
jgi:hypothetical protein